MARRASAHFLSIGNKASRVAETLTTTALTTSRKGVWLWRAHALNNSRASCPRRDRREAFRVGQRLAICNFCYVKGQVKNGPKVAGTAQTGSTCAQKKRPASQGGRTDLEKLGGFMCVMHLPTPGSSKRRSPGRDLRSESATLSIPLSGLRFERCLDPLTATSGEGFQERSQSPEVVARTSRDWANPQCVMHLPTPEFPTPVARERTLVFQPWEAVWISGLARKFG